MTRLRNHYNPDYAVPPGWILEERLESQSLSRAEFARRCELSLNLINGIIAGDAPIKPKIAARFEEVLGMDASIWLGIESDYRLHQECASEARQTERSA